MRARVVEAIFAPISTFATAIASPAALTASSVVLTASPAICAASSAICTASSTIFAAMAEKFIRRRDIVISGFAVIVSRREIVVSHHEMTLDVISAMIGSLGGAVPAPLCPDGDGGESGGGNYAWRDGAHGWRVDGGIWQNVARGL